MLKGKKTLRKLFIRYIIYFCFCTIFITCLVTATFSIMAANNVILAANYSEQQIENNKEVILKADKVTVNMIPEDCNYGVYNEKGKMLYGNFTTEESKNAWNSIKNNESSFIRNRYYKAFRRANDICIVQYSIRTQFKYPILRKYLLNPELSMSILLIIMFIGMVLLLSARFGKYLSKQMDILMNAAEKIKKQDLDFKIEHSHIHEIEEVISSLNEMKDALKDSLEKQWNMERSRKNQISALAHDIKTPLTIIKGNAELIKETSRELDNIKYNDYVLKGADEIEKYLGLLIDMTKSEDRLMLKPGKIETKMFFERIIDKQKALAFEKDLELVNEQVNVPEFFCGDEELLYRAIMNVISNGIEYSPKQGKIIFKIQGSEKMLEFSIEDSGRGFSKEELESASEQFYRGDKSRNSRNHYGMGLFITNSFTKLHRGFMKLSNSKETGGAKVVLKIPLITKLHEL